MKPLSKYNKKTILSEELFIEIFEQEDEIMKARMLLSCRDKAKELGVAKNFDDLVSAYRKVEKSMQKQTVTRSLLENWTNFTGTYENMKCGAWIASDEGIRTFNKDYTNEVIVCYHPILPIMRMKNLETGEEQLRIAFRRNRSWKEITVPKDIVSSANKIVALSKLGVSVTSENAKLLVKYLSDVENMNENEIPVQMSSSKLGWIGNGFIPYDKDIVFDGDFQFRHVYESICAHGDKAIWMNYIKKLRKSGRLEIKFSLAASFASVLVSQTGVLPFIVDLWGESEGGKSVVLMMAASVWANPSKKQYIGDFETSSVQLEVRADMLNHLPIMLDDSSKIDKKLLDDLEKVIYSLCSGKGKSRSNKDLGIRRENKWENCVLTNGERPLASYVHQGGAINRILEVECDKHFFPNPQEAVDVLKKNYGFAGIQFVKIIKEIGTDKLKEMQQEIQKEIYQEDKMQKQSISLSVVLLADKIITEYMFLDGEYIDREQAMKVLTSYDELSEHERCYRYLLDKVAMNAQRFDMDTNCEKWGVLEPEYAVIYPQALKELCKQGGFSDKAFLSWGIKKGVILTDKGRENKVKKINGKSIRCIFIKLLQEDETEQNDGEFHKISGFEQEQLPFD